MTKDYKKILIIDDSEVDREVLKNILSEEFSTTEAENGSAGVEKILKEGNSLDAILLDVSMPVMDGFGVLKRMEENRLNNIPVFLITAEATRENVANAAQYHISGFIRKPYDRAEVLWRLETKLGMLGRNSLTEEDIQETVKYIADLEGIYRRFLKNFGLDCGHYERMADLMEILLYGYFNDLDETDQIYVKLVSRAAFFCDIGNMLLPNNFKFKSSKQDEMSNDIYGHTGAGSSIIHLNYSRHCEYFVHICGDMCAHHHERYDGNGFPHKVMGNHNAVFTQMGRLVDEFDNMFYRYREHNNMQFEFVRGALMRDVGAIRPELPGLLVKCKREIDRYYNAVN